MASLLGLKSIPQSSMHSQLGSIFQIAGKIMGLWNKYLIDSNDFTVERTEQATQSMLAMFSLRDKRGQSCNSLMLKKSLQIILHVPKINFELLKILQ